MNININISHEVPDFFREMRKEDLKMDFPSLTNFIPSDIYSRYHSIIKDMVTIYTEHQQRVIPVAMAETERVIRINNNNYSVPASEIMELFKVNRNVLYSGKYLDLDTGFIFGTVKSTLAYGDMVDKITKALELQPLIDWYNHGQIFDNYHKEITKKEKQFELELLKMWWAEQVNFLKSL